MRKTAFIYTAMLLYSSTLVAGGEGPSSSNGEVSSYWGFAIKPGRANQDRCCACTFEDGSFLATLCDGHGDVFKGAGLIAEIVSSEFGPRFAVHQAHNHDATVEGSLLAVLATFEEEFSVPGYAHQGSTVAAVHLSNGILTLVHIGDSGVVVGGKDGEDIATDIFFDPHNTHNLDECNRVREGGGLLIPRGCGTHVSSGASNRRRDARWVCPYANDDCNIILSVGVEYPRHSLGIITCMNTRSIGDFLFKQKSTGVIATSEYSSYRVKSTDEFLIVASDGLWDVVSAIDAVTIGAQMLHENKKPQEIANRLVFEAVGKWGISNPNRDDISVGVLVLTTGPEGEEES